MNQIHVTELSWLNFRSICKWLILGNYGVFPCFFLLLWRRFFFFDREGLPFKALIGRHGCGWYSGHRWHRGRWRFSFRFSEQAFQPHQEPGKKTRTPRRGWYRFLYRGYWWWRNRRNLAFVYRNRSNHYLSGLCRS